MKLGTETGNLVNHIYATAKQVTPKIGMGATICMWSDRHACTIIDINKSGKTVTVQEDIATRIDKNGMSEAQDYEYSRNPKGRISKFRLNKRGFWVESGTKGKGNHLSIGIRREYYDYSF